jgi:hypothetical protein
MKLSSLFASAMGIVLAQSIIAGCSSNGSSAAVAPPVSAAARGQGPVSTSADHFLAMTTMAKLPSSPHAEHLKTGMMPNHGCEPWPMCLYYAYYQLCGACPNPEQTVSDFTDNEVIEYGPSLVTLTGFSEPYGQCVDAKGNTWITNFSGESVVEYARGGTQPIATLSTNGYSIGCSVSPNGDLAVANFSGPSGIGNIEVFKHASGTPTEYLNEEYSYLWPPGYDNKGNLFVEGRNYYGGTAVAELTAGGSSLEPVSINQTIYFPGSVMWDGKHITLTDQDAGGNPSSPATTIYQMSESDSGGLTVVGSTPLLDNCNGSQVDVVQPFILGRKNTPMNKKLGQVVIGGNLSCENRLPAWKYPAGGRPVAINSPDPAYVLGQAVSVGRK